MKMRKVFQVEVDECTEVEKKLPERHVTRGLAEAAIAAMREKDAEKEREWDAGLPRLTEKREDIHKCDLAADHCWRDGCRCKMYSVVEALEPDPFAALEG